MAAMRIRLSQTLALLLLASLLASSFFGCSVNPSTTQSKNTSEDSTTSLASTTAASASSGSDVPTAKQGYEVEGSTTLRLAKDATVYCAGNDGKPIYGLTVALEPSTQGESPLQSSESYSSSIPQSTEDGTPYRMSVYHGANLNAPPIWEEEVVIDEKGYRRVDVTLDKRAGDAVDVDKSLRAYADGLEPQDYGGDLKGGMCPSPSGLSTYFTSDSDVIPDGAILGKHLEDFDGDGTAELLVCAWEGKTLRANMYETGADGPDLASSMDLEELWPSHGFLPLFCQGTLCISYDALGGMYVDWHTRGFTEGYGRSGYRIGYREGKLTIEDKLDSSNGEGLLFSSLKSDLLRRGHPSGGVTDGEKYDLSTLLLPDIVSEITPMVRITAAHDESAHPSMSDIHDSLREASDASGGGQTGPSVTLGSYTIEWCGQP